MKISSKEISSQDEDCFAMIINRNKLINTFLYFCKLF